METLSMIYPPNRPLERPMEPSKFPVMYDYLLFIDSNPKGELIIGSSNVAGTYWEGTLQHYKSFKNVRENIHSGFFISNTTTSDAVFIDDSNKVSNITKEVGNAEVEAPINVCWFAKKVNSLQDILQVFFCHPKILLSEDNGSLLVLNTQQNAGDLLTCEKKFLKSRRVEKLSTWGPSKAIACYDSSIDLYDIQNDIIVLEKSYNNYHTDLVKCVDTNRSDLNLFASCSMDRKACIWDVRLGSPATVIYQNEFCSLTSIVWNNNFNGHLVIGGDSGSIYLVDTRKPKEVLNVAECFNSSVYKMVFSDTGKIAICGDTSAILVFNCNGNDGFEKVSELKNHTAIVRGLTWFNDTLYSCGFNKELFSYNL